MESQTDQLVTTADDVLIAETAGHRQRQIIVLRLLNQMQNTLKLITDLRPLTTETLRQKHREFGGIDSKDASDHRSIDALRA